MAATICVVGRLARGGRRSCGCRHAGRLTQLRAMGARARACCGLTVLLFVSRVAAADFGIRGGPEPANIDQISEVLQQDRYDMELLISFGTSKGGSAGHIALAIRNQAAGDD